jgi:hypothetical protein
VPGHWEGDLNDGKAGKSHIGTLVEWATRFTMLVPLPDSKGADVFAAAVTPVIAGLPDALRRSLTWDQGAEMTRHAQMPRILSPFPILNGAHDSEDQNALSARRSAAKMAAWPIRTPSAP